MADIIIPLSSEGFKKMDQILQVQKDAAVVYKALLLYFLRLFSFY